MGTRITVSGYAGYKGDERPVSFTINGETHQVREIVDRWYDPDYNYFQVLADDQRFYLLRYDLNHAEWDLISSTSRR